MYCGVSPTTFDKLVADKIMPKGHTPRSISRVLWDIRALDVAIDDMLCDGAPPAGTSWDDR